MTDITKPSFDQMTLEEKAALCTGASPGRPRRSNGWACRQ